jgi:hypothetical protein
VAGAVAVGGAGLVERVVREAFFVGRIGLPDGGAVLVGILDRGPQVVGVDDRIAVVVVELGLLDAAAGLDRTHKGDMVVAVRRAVLAGIDGARLKNCPRKSRITPGYAQFKG